MLVQVDGPVVVVLCRRGEPGRDGDGGDLDAGGRGDLLGAAAGTYKAAMADPTSGCWWAVAAMRLCVDAGADLDVARATVPMVAARLAAAGGGSAAASRHPGGA
ncbi:hypothetical protein GCM10011512_26190 [Tersicoccus solisilvae]|uniref:Carbohydrate kinase PfkB domain-containing protein n=1 Tax=Tersicoccus solisilvae TaxID=1882339 RepID=A0ABQ1PIX9_9MICC|nr:hypothetical protein [Tersicoccus solisilvae]GGC97997.1 hypothetical protein GCM10011512_26190 [Tersicoccus solisilvae]